MSNLPGGRTNLAQERANRAKAALELVALELGGAAYLNVGVTAGTVAAGNDPRLSIAGNLPPGATLVNSTDPRLSDSRVPKAHASTHALTGSDPIQALASGLVAAPPLGLLDIDHGDLVWDVGHRVQVTVNPGG